MFQSLPSKTLAFTNLTIPYFHYWTLFYRQARESDNQSDNPCIIAATFPPMRE